MLHAVDRRGAEASTVPEEVVPVKLAMYRPGQFRSLSEAAVELGAVRLVNPVVPVDKAGFEGFPAGLAVREMCRPVV